jgi:hypothetical protein
MTGTQPSRGAALAAGVALVATLASPCTTRQASAAATSSTGCPREMARVGDACVDRWEASLVEMVYGGIEISWSPYVPPNGHRMRAVSRPGVVPQAHISYREAKAACRNAGKRLCAPREWESACKGAAQTKFPYGEDFVAGVCVDTGRTSPSATLYPATKAFSYEGMNDPRLNQLPNTVEKTGHAAACTNELGVFDMVGNLHEWAADARFHGGYYLDTKSNGLGCDYVTGTHAGQYYDYSIGFRCCADVSSLPEGEPGELERDSERDADDDLMSRAASIDADLRALSSRVAALWTRARASNARR